jgi:hypothetical protein
MDFLTIWKASSIALTGAFGILGLVKDFKDKNGKITAWGRVALAGILLSTGFGVAAQLIESSKAEHTEKEFAKQFERGLSPLGEPKFGISFSLACDLPEFSYFCHTFTSRGTEAFSKGERWPSWPFGQIPILYLEINFFIDPNDATLYGEGKKGRGDLWFSVVPTASNNSLFAHTAPEGGVMLEVQHAEPSESDSDGKLKSILDLPGVTVVLKDTWEPGFNRVVPSFFMITFKDGQSILYRGSFEKVSAPRFTCFRFRLPPKQ